MTDHLSNHQDNDSLARMLGASAALHVLVLLLFTLRLVFYPSEPVMLDNAIRVDIVALPDKATTLPAEAPSPAPPSSVTTPEPPQPPAPSQVAPVPAPNPKIVISKPEAPQIALGKTKREQESALKRLEALDKLEKLAKQEAKSKQAAALANAKQTSTSSVAGNAISKGNALSGMARLEHATYLQNIDEVVKRHWSLPGWLANATLSARVRLYIDAQGMLIKKQIVQSSNNSVYDERVLAAVDASAPLPPPPRNLVNILAVDGVELEFVPE